MSKHVIIVGGGITGITVAYQLIKQGFKVSVVERHRYPAMETSYANGGQLSASNAEVWTHPSTMLKALKWLFRADAPLLVSPKPSWHKLTWFFEFLSNIPKYESNTIATASLAIAAREHLFAWAREEGIEFDLKQQGILHIYRDKKGFDHAAAVSKLLAKGGLERRAVSPSEMKAIEPNLSVLFMAVFIPRAIARATSINLRMALPKPHKRVAQEFLPALRSQTWAQMANMRGSN